MKSLKNTTAAVAVLTMALPQAAFPAAHVSLMTCADGGEPACVLDDMYVRVEVDGQGSITIPGLGTTEVKAKDLDTCPEELTLDATPCLTAEGDAIFALDGDEMTALLGAMDPVEMADEAVESDPVDGSDAAEASEAAPEGAVAADATEVTEEPATDTADAVTEETVEPAAEATAEAEVAAETETANTDGEVTIEEDTGAKVVEAPEAAETETETTAEASTETETTAETEVTAEAEPEIIVEDEPVASAAAAAVEGEADATATVETEEVTEENSRSADEDFETSAAGTETAAATDSGGDRGLSNFEKALILGLGAAVVGQALNNGDEVVSNSGDRVVVRQDNGELRVLKDDDALLRQPGSQVSTETFSDGSTRTTVLREDGTKIVTIRAADGRVVRRARVFEDGSQIVLFDDTEVAEPVNTAELPTVEQETIDLAQSDEDALRLALANAEARQLDRSYSLRQIRQIEQVRFLAPQIELDAITFATGSAAIQPSQAEELRALGNAMSALIEERPGEVFLIEGHTDTVGDASYNLALSDRRAETVALALSQYFGVPPENMITQGYGESQLKIAREGDIRENRRAVIRRITPLLRQVASAN